MMETFLRRVNALVEDALLDSLKEDEESTHALLRLNLSGYGIEIEIDGYNTEDVVITKGGKIKDLRNVTEYMKPRLKTFHDKSILTMLSDWKRSEAVERAYWSCHWK